MGGAITGQPKGLFVWDDPIKDHREAAKKDVRDDAWDFYKSSMRVRMSAGVLVMTHWHPDDPAGKILKEMAGNENADQWKVLDMPALMEPKLYAKDREEQRKKMTEGIYMSLKDALGRKEGEVLCAAMLSKKEMLKMRAGNEYFFTALFQQRPYLREGQRYKRDWFQIIPGIPEGVVLLCIVRYWDKAASAGKGDYAVGVLEALGSDFNFYFLNVVRGRWSTYERDKMMLKTAKRDQQRYGKGVVKIWHPQDPGSAGIDSALATNRLLRGYPAFFEPVTGSKETRSETLESSAQGKAVFLIQAPWNEEFIEEFTAFNSGTHDDQVDAGSSAHNKLLEMLDELDVEPPTEEIVIYQERVSISPV
jgi:predicted phage terminase large subunit-like protein